MGLTMGPAEPHGRPHNESRYCFPHGQPKYRNPLTASPSGTTGSPSKHPWLRTDSETDSEIDPEIEQIPGTPGNTGSTEDSSNSGTSGGDQESGKDGSGGETGSNDNIDTNGDKAA
eukprot:CAMPEP_0114503280 /NCGR_PEP_ID=MMETSP0109-20121206/9563_1 /TAXON_ID=29199 /ORGANISM="Chlorarachnion reptans, Strain CCCM449" /LENGTH=115 /DNA_ID=CAMNT_0001681297 /DNA_START=149 /DNA_END=496 /DNA_ORIENTATION=-